jgi:hypothetical protein
MRGKLNWQKVLRMQPGQPRKLFKSKCLLFNFARRFCSRVSACIVSSGDFKVQRISGMISQILVERTGHCAQASGPKLR